MKSVTSEIRYRNSSIPFNACTVWKRSKFKTQKLLRTTNPENFRSIGQILPKISYLKGEITPFEKMSFQFIVTKFIRIELR